MVCARMVVESNFFATVPTRLRGIVTLARVSSV